MKKYLILLFVFVLIGIYSCQELQVPKQYFDASPEIDLVKTTFDAVLNQDWETYRSCYSDTAKIWENTDFLDPGISIDKVIESMKSFIPLYTNYSYENQVWEMIIDNKGETWVYVWAKFVGKLSEVDDDIVIPFHTAYRVTGDKIVYEYGFWDNLPIYLAMQALETEDK